jgi:hypothetical protein
MTDDHVPFGPFVPAGSTPAKPCATGAPVLPGKWELSRWISSGKTTEEIQGYATNADDALAAWAGDDPEKQQQAQRAFFVSIRELSDMMVALHDA